MRKRNLLKAIGVCAFIPTLILIYGCIKTSKEVFLTSPSERKIPIRAGYYLPADLCRLEYFKTTAAGWDYLYIGETLCNGIETVLKTCFEDVVKLPSLDVDLTSYEIKAIVIPEIGFIDMMIASFSSEQAIVNMKWIITDAENNILWTDTIVGEAQRPPGFHTRFGRKKIMERAIQDQFQKAIESILRREWWKKPI